MAYVVENRLFMVEMNIDFVALPTRLWQETHEFANSGWGFSDGSQDDEMERETGIEPATNGLGSRYSTIELLPLKLWLVRQL